MAVPKGHTNQIESIQKCKSQSHLPYSDEKLQSRLKLTKHGLALMKFLKNYKNIQN